MQYYKIRPGNVKVKGLMTDDEHRDLTAC